jgi:hypothetical protein
LLVVANVSFEADGRDGLRGNGEDWREVWEAFCSFAREPADDPFDVDGQRRRLGALADYDLLLHESGVSRGIAYGVDVARQFSFEDEHGDYAGMNRVTVSFVCDRAPEGRVPQAQRWGYAGVRRDDVSDDQHAEMRNWAGWVDSWKRAVERSNSIRALDQAQPVRWHAFQSDI